MADADRGHVDGQVTRRKGSGWRELPVLVIVAFALALLIKAVLLQAFFIPSGSMEQTLRGCPGCTGDRVLVNKIVYDVRDVRRGEIVVFHGRGSWDADTDPAAIDRGKLVRRTLGVGALAVGASAPGEKDYIKRVIGLPGDRVACCTADGHVTV